MKKELLESYELIRKIRLEIPNKIKHQDARDYLELVIKNNFLEAQNVQLLLNLQLQARTISQLKSMIMRQQRYIQENHLDNNESNSHHAPKIDMRKIFIGKHFDEIEEDEDYKRLLVASPAQPAEKKELKKVEDVVGEEEEYSEEPDSNAGPVEELVGIIMGADPDNAVEEIQAASEDPPKKVEVEMVEDVMDLPKEEEKFVDDRKNEKENCNEDKGISITGVSAFKIEGKSMGPTGTTGTIAPSGEKKQVPAKKSSKETKAGKSVAPVQAQPTNLSVMVKNAISTCREAKYQRPKKLLHRLRASLRLIDSPH